MLGGQIYLVAYHQKITIDYADVLRSGSEPPLPPRLTPETILSLSLLDLRIVGSLNDIQRFSLADALKPIVEAAKPDLNAEANFNAGSDSNLVSLNNLHQIGLALTQCISDNDEVLPLMKTAAEADKSLEPYVKSNDVFKQPTTHELYQVNSSQSQVSLASFDSPATMVIFYEASPATDGKRAVLFLDSHVDRVSEAEWRQLDAASHIPTPPLALPGKR